MSTYSSSMIARTTKAWARLFTTTACLAAIAMSAHAGTSLISIGSPVRILVPTDDTLASSWWDTSLDDSSWTEGVNGVGYQTGAGGYEANILADSISEWSFAGQQGENYWSYGYYDKTGDADATYQAGDFRIFPRSPGARGVNNFWDGGAWNWYPDNVPWDSIGQTAVHPNGINNGAEHWVIRRWRSTYAGPITLVFKFAKGNTSCCGVTGKILQNGAEIFSRAIAGGDTVGYTVYVTTTVAVGDLLDFAQTPIGLDGDTGDGSDASVMSARVYAGTIVEPVATTDSVNDWSATGTQGAQGWFYGYYIKTDDADGVYDPATDFGTTDPNWTFLNGAWNWGAPDDSTWTTIGQTDWHPNGINNAKVHWAIRRWVSTVSGDLNARVQFGKVGTCDNGTTLHVFHNGTEMFSRTIAGTDTTGFSTFVSLPGVAVGDFIEFALDPLGTDAAYTDGCDSSRLKATIYPGAPFQPGLQADIATDVQAQMKGVNSSVYVRIPFQVADPSAIQTLKLKLKWNDGYVAYLNGNAIDKKNAPTVISGNTVADSIVDWSATGEQGFNGWYYGYYDRSLDGDNVFQVENLSYFPRDGAGYSATDFWNGSGYDWFNGNPPWDEIYQENFHPNAPNGAVVDPANHGTHEHWLVRRWTAQTDGDLLKVRIKFAKNNTGCGDGITGYIFHNGTQLYAQSIAGNDGVGRDDVVDVPNVLFGDQIDILMSPGPNDNCDGSKFSAVIFDGAPIVPWNAAALAARTPDESIAPTIIDIPVSLLNAGDNLLALQGINVSANDDNFLIAAELVANNLPTAVADSLLATAGQALDVSVSAVLANDTDPDGDAIQIVGVTPGGVTTAGGSVALLGERLVYTPAAGFSGTDSFTYTIADGSGVPVEGTVQVKVINLTQSYASFDSALPEGSSIYGLAGLNLTGGVNDSGVLRITDAVNGQAGTFITGNALGGQPVTEFTLQAMVRIAGATCCTAGRNELRPADGMSFNFASDIPNDAAWSAGALEEGVGTGLRVTFDTWDSGDGPPADSAPAIELIYNGAVKATAYLDGWRDNNNPDAGMIPLDPQNGAPLTLYTDARDQTFVRVTSGPKAGEIYQCHQGDGTPDLATLPEGKLAGPTIYVGLAGNETTSLVPPPPGPGYIALIQRGTYAFAIKASNALAVGYAGVVIFNQPANGENYIIPGMGAPAALIPTVMVGHSRGLAIAGVADASALVEGAPGADISIERVTPPVAPYGQFAWTLRSDGSCDIWWKGVKIIDNVQTGYTPIAGRFGIGGRTGGANEAHWVDELLVNYYAIPGAPQILSQPASVAVGEGRSARFEVLAAGSPSLAYQWNIDGQPLDGVTGPILTLSNVAFDQNGAIVTVVVTNPEGSVTSQDAVLTVIQDFVPPTVVSVVAAPMNRLIVTFSEAVDPGTASDGANYLIDGGALGVGGVIVNGNVVTLTTDAQVPGQTYTLVVDAVQDLFGNPVDPNSTPFTGLASVSGVVLRQFYYGLDGGITMGSLTNNPKYPNSPDAFDLLPTFISPQTSPDLSSYGARLRAYLIPSETGFYSFDHYSDDAGITYISLDGNPANKQIIYNETGCCAHHTSPQFFLTAGMVYYLEGIFVEGGGGDYLELRWATPSNPGAFAEIPSANLSVGFDPAAIAITQQPQDITTPAKRSVSFSIVLSNPQVVPLTYQWQRAEPADPATFVDIPGATAQTYATPLLELTDSGALYRVVVGLGGIPALTSDAATVTVVGDLEPPTLVSASGSASFTQITVRFNEAVDAGTANDNANYGIDGGLNINAAAVSADGLSVVLTTDFAQAPGTLYTVTVSAVQDLAGNPIADFSTVSFTTFVFTPGVVRFDYFNNLSTADNVLDTTLLVDPRYPNNPTATYYITAFNSRQVFPNDTVEGYGARMTGVFVPPTSGNYVFWLLSDDSSRMWLNPTGTDPAGKVQIAEETACCGPWSKVFSSPQPLTAGQAYYVEAVYKEGTGGDYLQVGATLEGQPAPTDPTRDSIQGNQLGGLYDPMVAELNVTQQPQDQLFLFDPLAAQALLNEDFSAGNGNFTVETPQAYDGPWVYSAGTGSWTQDGQAAENSRPNTSKLNSPTYRVASSGNVQLTFTHRYSFEGGFWDGGQVRVSINGGPYNTVPGSAFIANGYNGTVLPNSASELKGQEAFVEDSPGYASGPITSVIDLGTLNAGDTVAVQFMAASDTNTRGQFTPNWEISSISSSTLRPVGLSAYVTFSVGAEGSLGGQPTTVYYQWQKDAGTGFTDIPGATAASYTLAPLVSDNGSKFRARLIIPGSTQFSGEATLTAVQLNTAPSFAKGPDQSAQCATGPQAVAGWATDIKPHSIPQQSGSFANTFDSGPRTLVPQTFSTDFTGGLPAGTVASGTTPPYVGAEGALHLTDLVNSQLNFWNVPMPMTTALAFSAQWKNKITGVGGADGFSFNVGQDLGVAFTPEEGGANGLSLCVDTYNNGAADAGVEIKYNGARLGFLPVGPGIDTQGAPAELARDVFVDVSVDVTDSGLVTFTYDTFVVTGQIPGYTGIPFNQYLFAARTGGANENCWIDDLSITASTLQGAPAPAGTQLYGNAYIADGSVHLTDAANGQVGSFIVQDILGGGRLGSFEMAFTAQVGGGTAPPADGFAVSVANDLPSAAWGEDGAGTGLTISFDSYDNGGGEAPAIDVLWNGAVVAHTLVPSIETGGNFVPVSIRLDADGTLDVMAAGTPVYTDLATGYVPILGARFGLGGRTGGLNENNWIDDLSITAFPVDASSAEAGQSVQFIVSNDNAALFAVQPAVSPNGTLTYTPAITGSGVANVSVVLKDDGGTAYGGQDSSAAQTFTITMGCGTPTFTTTQIGGGPLGSITPNPEPGSYTVEGGGSDIWDMSDEFTFHYIPVTGDFDVRVRVESVEVTARWPKAGIMARETLAGDSRMAFSKVTPAGPITPAGNCGQTEGAADVSLMYRTWIPGAGGNGGQHEDRLVADPGYPTYKWVRLQRVGSVMKGYASADGVIWQAPVAQDTANWLSPVGGVMTPFAQNSLLGLAVSRHGCTEESAPGDTATTEFREMATQPPVILVQPASVVSAAGMRATFSVTMDGSYTSVQWKKNGVDIPGANSTIYTTPILTADNDAEVFSVVLVNQFTGDSVTSDEAMLEVAGEFPGDVLTHRYNFNADANDSVGTAHGTLVNGAAIAGNAVAMNGSQQYVDLPNGLFDTYQSVTFEAWATDNNSGAWARLWDFGNTTLGEDPAQGGAGYSGANYMFFTWPIGDLTGVRGAYKQSTTGEQIVGDLRPRPSVGVKHHIVWVQDGTAQSARIYIDGQFTGQSFFSFKPSECGPYLNNWLGRSMYQGDSYFNGSIDEFRVFNAAVPAEYVAASFALGPDQALTTGPVTIAGQPANTSANPGATATFQVVLNGSLPYTAQWFRNGVLIPGATSPIYTFTATPADDGASYYAEVGNPFGTATSASAVLSVFDLTPPTLVSAAGTVPTQFDVVFSETVEQGSAEDTANYSMSAGVTISGAVLQADGKTVRITCSPLDGLGRKVLTVNDVTDRATPPNLIAPNSEIPVIFAVGSITRRLYSDIGGGVAISDLRNAAKFPNSPDVVDTRTELEAPWDFADNYGQQMLGWISPPISGDYTFYISSDDNAELWLSTDENPANITRIAIEPVWAGRRLWTGNGGDDTAANANRGGTSPNVSAPIPLVAGQRYYIEALNKEGGGGDNLAVAWRKPGDFVPAQGSAPIPGAFLSPNFPPTITVQPVDVTVEQTKPASFTVDFIGLATVKWFRDGAEIPGAAGKTYSIPQAAYPDDDQATFYAVIENELGSATSATATLTVQQDATPPTVVSVIPAPLNRVVVTFSEPMDPGTGVDSANYLIDGGVLGVSAAVVNGNVITLTTDPQTAGQIYSLVVENVTDIIGNPVVANETPFTALASLPGVVLRQFYYNLDGGTSMGSLTNNPKYPGSPDAFDLLPTFISPQTSPDIGSYGVRLRAYLIPSETGFYTFDHYSDDAGITYISLDGNPAHKQVIYNETGCCAHRTSPQFFLNAGTVYYLEGLMVEGGGGDYLELRWATPSNPGAFVEIPSDNLSVGYDPTQIAISQQPQDVTVTAKRSASFSIVLSNPQVVPLTYQWQRAEVADPGTFVDIAGATAQTYTTPLLEEADSGALYRVVIALGGIPALQSDAATVTVLPDADAPLLVSAKGSASFVEIIVRFNEALDSGTANDSANYGIDGGLNINGATLSADGLSVKLTTDAPQTQGTLYTVTVSAVQDLAGNPIADGSTVSFTAFVFTPGVLQFDYFNNIGGVAVSDLTANPRFPDDPTATYFMSSFNTRLVFPDDSHENYGARISGVFIPPADGSYVFWVLSDDASQLFLNPAGSSPAGKVLIAEEPACCGPWSKVFSVPQPLVAGQQYYIEGLLKEGGGGDYMQVAARLEGEPAPTDPTIDSIPSSSLGVYSDPTGATITITKQPDDLVYLVAANPIAGQATAFTVEATASRPGVPSEPIAYQWQKNAGAGWVDIPGANASVYDLMAPSLADNGTLFRAKLIISGLVETTREALLTVAVFNTPPSFSLAPPPASDSGTGPQTVPGVAQDILPCTVAGTIIKPRIGLNFAANDNGAALGLAPTETAGVVAQGNWNNLENNSGSASSLVADYTGRAKTTAASVTWSCPNTWASTGRGEENNAFPVGADRKMMTGYLDTDNAAGVVTVTVADLGPDFTTGGYDVIVYALGGTSASRWGAYSIGTATQILNSAASPTGFVLDPGVSAADNGNYAVFKDLTGSSFTLIANAVTAVGNGTRAPVNGVQIIAKAAIPPAAPANVLRPGDPVVLVNGVNDGDGNSGAPPGAEGVENAINGVTQKYLNFLDLGSGFAVTPSYGPSVVTGIRLYTANDAEERDPASYMLEGSTVGSAGPWTLIAQGPLALPSGRNPGGSIAVDPATQFNQLVSFPNATAYSSYRVTFPTLKNAGAANSMQIAEVELLGTEFAQKDCGPESSQSVQFIVSSDNAAMFSVQPAISPDGTLTYTAANCGQAQVSVVAMDDGGTAFGGDDMSDPQTFTLTVNCVNHAPVVRDLAGQTPQDKPMIVSVIKLLAGASDPDPGQTLTVSAAGPASANGGTVVLSADSVTYTPPAGFSGPDTFPFTVSDGNGGLTTATVAVTVLPANRATRNIYKVTVVGGNYVIGFAGLPGTTYDVQRAPSVTGPWTTVDTITIGNSAVAEYTDSDPNRPNPVFYRAIPQP